jgi:hypothetical protein
MLLDLNVVGLNLRVNLMQTSQRSSKGRLTVHPLASSGRFGSSQEINLSLQSPSLEPSLKPTEVAALTNMILREANILLKYNL